MFLPPRILELFCSCCCCLCCCLRVSFSCHANSFLLSDLKMLNALANFVSVSLFCYLIFRWMCAMSKCIVAIILHWLFYYTCRYIYILPLNYSVIPAAQGIDKLRLFEHSCRNLVKNFVHFVFIFFFFFFFLQTLGMLLFTFVANVLVSFDTETNTYTLFYLLRWMLNEYDMRRSCVVVLIKSQNTNKKVVVLLVLLL